MHEETRKLNVHGEPTFLNWRRMQSLLLVGPEVACPGALLASRVSLQSLISRFGCDSGENGYTPKTVQSSCRKAHPHKARTPT